jgi:hypothetical protein
VFQFQYTVDKHVFDANGRLRRIVVSGQVIHALRIENGDVGEITGFEFTALAQPHPLRR